MTAGQIAESPALHPHPCERVRHVRPVAGAGMLHGCEDLRLHEEPPMNRQPAENAREHMVVSGIPNRLEIVPFGSEIKMPRHLPRPHRRPQRSGPGGVDRAPVDRHAIQRPRRRFGDVAAFDIGEHPFRFPIQWRAPPVAARRVDVDQIARLGGEDIGVAQHLLPRCAGIDNEIRSLRRPPARNTPGAELQRSAVAHGDARVRRENLEFQHCRQPAPPASRTPGIRLQPVTDELHRAFPPRSPRSACSSNKRCPRPNHSCRRDEACPRRRRPRG